MNPPERTHNTKIPYIVDLERGPEERVINLETMTYDELVDRLFMVPEAIEEIIYRDMLKAFNNTNK